MLRQIRVSLTVAVALLSASLAFAQASDYDRRPRTASVSGRVTIGGKPAANVTVRVIEPQSGTIEARIFTLGGRDYVDHYFHEATTDAEGRYQIRGLPAGAYVISPKAPAYVPESKSLGLDASVKITLDEAEAREKVDFALVRGGVITGRVTDEDGRPQVGRYIKLLDLIGDNQWHELSMSYEVLETDDRGIYRIFGLRGGRYIVKAGGENDTLRYAISGKKTQVTYHPDVVKQEEARVIELAEGKEVTGVDIKLRNPVEMETYAVSGRVINFGTGKPLPQIRVTFVQVENQEHESGNWAVQSTSDADGDFTATGVKPGKYKARIFPWSEGEVYYSEGKYFEVSDGDVGGVDVVARRGATINGVVIVEDGRSESVHARLSQAEVVAFIHKEYLIGNVQQNTTVGAVRARIGTDGSFRMAGIPPGKMRFQYTMDSIYLLRIERNGIDLSDELEVGAGEDINGVRIIVGQGSGVIRGSLKIVGGPLPEGL